jgi:hypothetical protein
MLIRGEIICGWTCVPRRRSLALALAHAEDLSCLTTSALQKDLQTMDGSGYRFFKIDHFMETCLKFKSETTRAKAQSKVVYKNTQKKAKQPKIAFFFTKSSVSSFALNSFSFHSPKIVRPETKTSSQ